MLEGIRRSIRESPALWGLGLFFLTFGIGMIFAAHEREIEGTDKLLPEILRDVGIALCISVFIAALIEIGLAHKMAENVLDAIMRQTVDPEVWNEIRQHVILQAVLRSNLELCMTITGTGPDYRLTTTLDYQIESLRDFFNHRLQHELDFHRIEPADCGYQEIKVDEKALELKKVVSDDRLIATFDVYFVKAREKKSVKVEFIETVAGTDVINWWTTTATKGLTVGVTVPLTDSGSPALAVTIQAHHPAGEFKPDPHIQTKWTFEGVMLPGQGFEIRLTPKK